MAKRKLDTVIHYLRRLVDAPAAGEPTDAELLRAFAAQKDGAAAFAALVQRHGAMVLNVCRRVLGNAHDAEDAFQVTFMLLLQHGRSIGKREAVASWLYSVAYRAALRAKLMDDRRRRHEQEAVTVPPAKSPEIANGDWELRDVLDEELHRLPQRYMAPLVLHYLEGKTTKQVARLLRCPEGTVWSRLSRGREVLRRRLVRRGLTLTGGALAAVTAETASAGVPAALAKSTIEAAMFVTAGRTAAAVLSANVLQLTSAMSQAMFMARLRMAFLVMLVFAVGAGGAGMIVFPSLVARHETRIQRPGVAEVPWRLDLSGDPLPAGAVARMGSLRFKVPSGSWDVSTVAFASDNKTLISMGPRHVRLWDAVSGKRLHTIDQRFESDPSIYSADCNSDGVAVASSDGMVRIWDLASRRQRTVFRVIPSSDIALSPHGDMLATYGPYTEVTRGSPLPKNVCGIDLWDTTTGKKLCQLTGHQDSVLSVVFSCDGRTLVSGSADRTIRFWDVTSGKELRRIRGLDHGVGKVAISPDGKRLASIGYQDERDPDPKRDGFGRPGAGIRHIDNHVHIWDAVACAHLCQIDNRGHMSIGSHRLNCCIPLAFAPDSRSLATCGNGVNTLWDAASGAQLAELQERGGINSSWARSLAVSSDGRLLASCEGAGLLHVWDLNTRQSFVASQGHRDPVCAVALSRDGATLVSAGADNTFCLWEVATGKEIRRIAPMGTHVDTAALALSDDRSLLVSVNRAGMASVWDVASGERLRRLEKRGQVVALGPAGAVLADGSVNRTIRLSDTRTGAELGRINVPSDLLSLAFSRDGFHLLGLTDPAVSRAAQGPAASGFIWDWVTGKELQHFESDLPANSRNEQESNVAFSLDGSLVAVRSIDGMIRIRQTVNGEKVSQCGADSRIPPVCLVFSPDNKLLATVYKGDSIIRLWDVATGKQCSQLVGHEGQVRSLTFSRDGRSLVSGSQDTTILVWDLSALDESHLALF
jgi:RNA polymerase sigma factor (sigma-70 family)